MFPCRPSWTDPSPVSSALGRKRLRASRGDRGIDTHNRVPIPLPAFRSESTQRCSLTGPSLPRFKAQAADRSF